MFVMLPPILLDATLEVDKRALRRHAARVVAFAVVGTSLSTVATALAVAGATGWSAAEALTFGSLIAPTDPCAILAILKDRLHVSPKSALYIGVFGESILNDAVSFQLYAAFAKRLVEAPGADVWGRAGAWAGVVGDFCRSSVLAVAIGAGAAAVAYALLRLGRRRGAAPAADAALFLFLCLVPYYVGLALDISSVLGLVVAALLLDAFGLPLLCGEGERAARELSRTVALLNETLVFCYLGVVVVETSGAVKWDAKLAALAVAAALLGRLASTVPLVAAFAAADRWAARRKASRARAAGVSPRAPRTSGGVFATSAALFFAGIRGCTSWVLAASLPPKDVVTDGGTAFDREMKAMTLAVVLFTTFALGGLAPVCLRGVLRGAPPPGDAARLNAPLLPAPDPAVSAPPKPPPLSSRQRTPSAEELVDAALGRDSDWGPAAD